AERLRHARAALAESLPELGDAPPDRRRVLTARLVSELAAPQPTLLPPAGLVRRRGARRTWYRTGASLGLAGVLVGAAVFTLAGSDHSRRVPVPPVPKPSTATLAPDQQAGRLQPMTA
ncbi:MAG: hypothetical protein ACRDP3_00120, partial [Streptomyces sp.]